MLKYWLGIVGLFVWVGCSTSFTPQEVKVIKEGGGIMRVWKTDNREDSLFLRQQAIELTPGEIRTELFQVLKQRMLATVNDSADPGVGIAAPQVGISRQLIAVQRYDKKNRELLLSFISTRVLCRLLKSSLWEKRGVCLFRMSLARYGVLMKSWFVISLN